MNDKVYAQGDIILVPCEGQPDEKTRVNAAGEPAVVAEGEHTGMKHALYENATMFRDDALARDEGVPSDLYLGHVVVGEGGAKLEHGESQGAQGDHASIDVPPGTYHARGQREHREGRASQRAMD